MVDDFNGMNKRWIYNNGINNKWIGENKKTKYFSGKWWKWGIGGER